MKINAIQLRIAGLTIGIALALSIMPPTRWLARVQLTSLLRGGDGLALTPSPVSTDLAKDVDVQMALAGSGTTDDAAGRLDKLTVAFPGNPAIYANSLRFASIRIHLNRAKDELIAFPSVGSPGESAHDLVTPTSRLDAFEADSEAGERLDPDNAYFPLMRACGLFAVRNDNEALKQIMKAGSDGEWKEYTSEYVQGLLRARQAQYGDQSAMGRIAVASSVLFPQYALMRDAVRMTAAKAVALEKSGDTVGGLRLRQALRHIGGLMRVNSTSYVGSLVGIAIVHIAYVMPGATADPNIRANVSDEQRTALLEDRTRSHEARYEAYLRQIGQPREATAVAAELAADEVVRGLWSGGSDVTLSSLSKVADAWAVNFLLLANVVSMLIVGTLGAIAGRLPGIRVGIGLSHSARWGFWCAVAFIAVTGAVLAILPTAARAAGSEVSHVSFGGELFGCIAFVWVVTTLCSIEKIRDALRAKPAVAWALRIFGAATGLVIALIAVYAPSGNAGPVGISLVAFAVIGAGLASGLGSKPYLKLIWPPIVAVVLIVALYTSIETAPALYTWTLCAALVGISVLGSVVGAKRFEAQSYYKFLSAFTLTILIAGLTVFATFQLGSRIGPFVDAAALSSPTDGPPDQPLGKLTAAASWLVLLAPEAVIVIAAIFLRRGRSATAAVVNTLRTVAVPVGCVLMFAYTLSIVATLRVEARANYVVDQMTSNEGRYFAVLSHRAWPAVVE